MISAKQALLARTMIDKSQADVAQALGWAHQTLSKIENGSVNPPASRLRELQDYFENAGVEFLSGDGIRRRPEGTIRTLKGYDGFREFIYDVYDTTQKTGREICVSNVDERQFERWQGQHAQDYLSKMAALPNLVFKILIKENDDYYTAKYAEYRWISAKFFTGVPFYVYGNKMALILFSKDNVAVYVIENEQIANAQRIQFNISWEMAKPTS